MKKTITSIWGWLEGHLIPLIALALLIFAYQKHPYFYYQVLRWVVCITFVLYIVTFSKSIKVLMVISLILAVIYNPISPLHMRKSDWFVANIITAIVLVIYILIPSRLLKKEDE